MKRNKKKIAFIIAVLTILVCVPMSTAYADSFYTRDCTATITWYGSDPTPITLFMLTQEGQNFYQIKNTWTMTPSNYDSGTHTFSAWVSITVRFDGDYNAPFFAVSRDDLNGKWYCDKWDWNNLLYQPGAYVVNDSKDSFLKRADFFLTSSAPTNNSITVNRTWAADAPPTDTSVNLYRHYKLDGYCDDYRLLKSITLPAGQSSVKFDGLYGGDYAVTQTLPAYYDDDSTDTFTYANTSITDTGKAASLNSGTAASLSFADTYNPPPISAVSVAAISGGTVTPDRTTATEGSTVTLTVAPDTNKQLKSGSLKYTDSSGDHLISGTSFVMPGEAVTISAEFEPKQYTISAASISGGTVSTDKSMAASRDTVTVTVTPGTGKQLRPGTLKYTDSSGDHTITGNTFEMPQSNVTVSAQFETPISITTASLPDAMKGNSYSTAVSAKDGWAPYTWSAEGLPSGLSINASTGVISGTPTKSGSFDVTLIATDTGGTTAQKTLSLFINDRCGNGGYLITPDTSVNYTWRYGDGGLPTMTVGSGVSGFKTFSVSILTQAGHPGDEALLFVHMRNGTQIGISANFADYDTITTAKAAFNVKPGDIIKVYIVDDLSSDTGRNPIIL